MTHRAPGSDPVWQGFVAFRRARWWSYAAGLVFAVLMLGGSGPALAQDAGEAISPSDVERWLVREGFVEFSRPHLQDDVYVVEALSQARRRYRLVIDAESGEVLEDRVVGEPRAPDRKARRSDREKPRPEREARQPKTPARQANRGEPARQPARQRPASPARMDGMPGRPDGVPGRPNGTPGADPAIEVPPPVAGPSAAPTRPRPARPDAIQAEGTRPASRRPGTVPAPATNGPPATPGPDPVDPPEHPWRDPPSGPE